MKNIHFERIDSIVQGAIDKLGLPGASLCITGKDGILYEKGYGLRDVERKLPMTEHTVFYLASVSKAFTATGIGLLQDKGKLCIDAPAADYIPDFKMYDDYATKNLTIRDMLNHISGLPRHDLTWYANEERPTVEYVRGLRWLKPTCQMRTKFQYNNIMFTTAAYITELLSGQTWDVFLKEEFFDKLGMTSTCAYIKNADPAALTTGYMILPDGTTKIAEPLKRVAGGGAGGIFSSAHDMAAWIAFHLNRGTAGGAQIVKPETMQRLHTPVTLTNGMSLTDKTQFSTYHYGWMSHFYKGKRITEHGGGMDGVNTYCVMLPDEEIGFCLLTNQSGGGAGHIICHSLYDELLDVERTDWHDELRKVELALKKKNAEERDAYQADTAKARPLIHPAADYVGVYEHPAYGMVTIREQNGALAGTFGRYDFDAAHSGYDYFKLRFAHLGFVTAKFETDVKGGVPRLLLDLEPALGGDMIPFDRT